MRTCQTVPSSLPCSELAAILQAAGRSVSPTCAVGGCSCQFCCQRCGSSQCVMGCRPGNLACSGDQGGSLLPASSILMAHVSAAYDSQEGRQGPSLLVAGAQRPGGAAGDPADGGASRRAR